MKKVDRNRLRLRREAVKVLVSIVSGADLVHVQGGGTSAEECSEISCLGYGCHPQTEA